MISWGLQLQSTCECLLFRYQGFHEAKTLSSSCLGVADYEHNHLNSFFFLNSSLYISALVTRSKFSLVSVFIDVHSQDWIHLPV